MNESLRASRDSAILRGLDFIYRTACDPDNFSEYGFDYLFCLHWIYSTSKDKHLRKTALQMGRERALYWRRENPSVPTDADADIITSFVFASDSADRLGVRDDSLRPQIGRAAKDFGPQDYFWFDPRIEPPPADVPEACACGMENPRGRKVCRRCKKKLTMMSHYEVWLVALIRSYIGERYGVTLGTRYEDVIKWLPMMRPYCGPEGGYDYHFGWAIYAITHIVYTLNHYGRYNLSPGLLPGEFKFLKKHLKEAIRMKDSETVGEMLDSLKSFGLTSSSRLIQKGEAHILSDQNADGSWGDVDDEDIYGRYHPTVTAINGLREYAWKGVGLSFPRLKPLLEKWARGGRE
jgi:hypothetical protein